MTAILDLHSPAVAARGLVKTFGALRAVDGVDLEVPRGMIFGILGPNGAGKTTLLRMLATLLKPNGGSAQIMGNDLVSAPHEVRKSIAMTGQFASLDEDLTGHENLTLLAKLWGFRRHSAARADQLLEAFELSEAARRQVKEYSGGMRRRLDIAASLVVTPSILFLDEPSTGLDPSARQNVWHMIRTLAAQGVTILLTTQYLEEADQLAARIAVIDHGKKIAEGSSRELKAMTGSGYLRVTLADQTRTEEAARLLERQLGGEAHCNMEGTTLSIKTNSPEQANTAVAALTAAGIPIDSFSMAAPSLDEVFFALTGHAPDDVTQTGERK